MDKDKEIKQLEKIYNNFEGEYVWVFNEQGEPGVLLFSSLEKALEHAELKYSKGEKIWFNLNNDKTKCSVCMLFEYKNKLDTYFDDIATVKLQQIFGEK